MLGMPLDLLKMISRFRQVDDLESKTVGWTRTRLTTEEDWSSEGALLRIRIGVSGGEEKRFKEAKKKMKNPLDNGRPR